MENFKNNLEDSPNLKAVINGCLKGSRDHQKVLYEQFYGYAISICLRYAHSTEEAKEILNDGFMKVFTRLAQLKDGPFKPWLRRILINTAIDHYRASSKHYNVSEINSEVAYNTLTQASAIDDLSHQELILLIQQLSPAYRTVFNLYVIDGYTHEEIATQLQISVGASKSNLFKAREHLKTLLEKVNVKAYVKDF